MTEARAQGTKAASAVAVTASMAALACGVCCVLPFAVPAAILGSIRGVLAWFAEAYRWLTPIALVAVGAGWAWVGYQSWRTRRSPAHSTLLVMTFATIMMVAAWIWPNQRSSPSSADNSDADLAGTKHRRASARQGTNREIAGRIG